MNFGLNNIERRLTTLIIGELDKIGVHYRIFSRVKDVRAIEEKINRKEKEGKIYEVGGNLMQDLIGIRVVTYFQDDIDVIKKVISRRLHPISEQIDDPDTVTFKPKRTNIICPLVDQELTTFKEVQSSGDRNYSLFDKTIEIQLRTILSEGWHEIDHSLRYKCKPDWEKHSEKERMLNGIYASLETNDIVLKNLFTELAYQQFKNGNWEALLRNKLRLRFQNRPLSDSIVDVLNNDVNIGKSLLRVDRTELLIRIYEANISLPINFDNYIYIFNLMYDVNKELIDITPGIIKEMMN